MEAAIFLKISLFCELSPQLVVIVFLFGFVLGFWVIRNLSVRVWWSNFFLQLQAARDLGFFFLILKKLFFHYERLSFFLFISFIKIFFSFFSSSPSQITKALLFLLFLFFSLSGKVAELEQTRTKQRNKKQK